MPNFTYTRDVPDAPHNPSADQTLMKTNTNSSDSILLEDHFGFNNNLGGWHKKSTYLTSVPTPVSTANQIILFGTNVSGLSVLSMVRDNAPLTLTNLTTAKITAPTITASGISWLPGEILMQWGTVTNASGVTVPFNMTFPGGVFSIQCTLIQNTTNRHFVYVKSFSNSDFVPTQLDSGGSAEVSTFNWVAIGN